MKKYQYKVINKLLSEEDLNELGSQGWSLVGFQKLHETFGTTSLTTTTFIFQQELK